MKALLVGLFGLAGAFADQVRRFDGDVVLRCSFDFTKSDHKDFYQTLLNQDRDYVEFWGRNDIHLTPKSFEPISSALAAHQVPCTTLVNDVQALVDAEREYSRHVRNQEAAAEPYRFGDPNPDPFFNDYRTNDEIDTWCRNLASTYATTTYTKIGTSYQGRDLMVLKITNGPLGRKPVIFYEGGIHAREWISPATVLYIAGKLTRPNEQYQQELLEKFEWHIVPVVNRDGYNYTWTTDRSWRKTRKPNTPNPCIGTDPNRNWDDHWCELGASTSPCSDSYCGSAPFTEPEVLAMANHIKSIQTIVGGPRVKMAIDWHAYGQLWMAPYGWSGALPPDGAAQQTVGNIALTAINATNGLRYQYGTIYNIIYPASGSSADYFYDVWNITYAYGVELRDTGTYGFQLPASQIRPQGEEIWNATVRIAQSF
jgi:murein tripeptide amidase MpaA